MPRNKTTYIWIKATMTEFDAIRPYNDDEVRSVLQRLIRDNEFLNAIIALKVPAYLRFLNPLIRPCVRYFLSKQVDGISSIGEFQTKIDPYLRRVIDTTMTELSVSGLDKLDKNNAYLFISNHRDIAMDPACVNWTLYQNDFNTLRIAIGDNLLTKPFASDIMRLNKCFIVNRSATGVREKFKAAKLLSQYIHASVKHDKENIWIAQREGRAKDGLDKTNNAIISMLAMSKAKTETLADYIRDANIVPVSISYEYDPCDADKARELTKIDTEGAYVKDEHEDVSSIAKGITGLKGRVHLHFGDVLDGSFETTEQVANEIEQKIIENYHLQLSNCFAYEVLEGKSPDVLVGKNSTAFLSDDWSSQRVAFKLRLDRIDEAYRPMFLAAYANPVKAKLAQAC